MEQSNYVFAYCTSEGNRIDSQILDVYYFFGNGCPACKTIDSIINEIEIKYPLKIHRFDIYSNRSHITKFEEFCEKSCLPIENCGIPAVFVGNRYFMGANKILNSLEDTIKTILDDTTRIQKEPNHPENEKISVNNNVSIYAITIAAFIDAVSPCSIAILVFLIGVRILTSDKKKGALKVGLSFCLAVFISYSLFGFGLISLTQIGGFSTLFSFAASFFAIGVGFLYIKDVFWYGRWGFTTEVPTSLKPKLMKILKGVTSPVGAFAAGFVASCFELPCTGGPYLFILGQLANNSTRTQTIPLLIYYNLIFIMPLVIISFLLYSNVFSTTKLRDWNKQNTTKLKFISGLLIIILGILVIPQTQIIQAVYIFYLDFMVHANILLAFLLILIISILAISKYKKLFRNSKRIPRALFPRKFLYAIALILLIIIVPIVIYYFIHIEDDDARMRELLMISNKAKRACLELPNDVEQTCINIVDKRTNYYVEYSRKLEKQLDIYDEAISFLSNALSIAKKECDSNITVHADPDPCITHKMINERLNIVQYMKAVLSESQNATTMRVYNAIEDTPQIVFEKGVNTKVICKVKDTGQVNCILLESLLAYFDADMGNIILNDIDRLYEVLELDYSKDLLFSCGPGVWGGTSLTEFGISDPSEISNMLIGEEANKLIEICIGLGRGSTSGEGTSAEGGFSGITGIDTFGFGSMCGMDVMTSFDTIEEINGKLLDTIDAYTENCEMSPQGSIMSGGADAETQTAQNPPHQSTDEGPSEDAEEVSSETTYETDSEGNVESVTTTTTYSDSTTVTVTTDLDTGVSTINVDYYDEDGNLIGWADAVYDPNDGGGSTTWTSSDNPGVETKIYDVSPDYKHTKDDQGNSWVEGPTHIIHQNALEDVYVYDKLNRDGYWIRSKQKWAYCDIDMACQTCRDYAEFIPDIIGDCISSGGSSYSCQAYGMMAECCSNSNAFPGDPRIVLPDPEGNFMCMGDGDIDLKSENCERKCSIAEHEDCYSNCMSANDLGSFKFDIWDIICRYAISEDCFSNRIDMFTREERFSLAAEELIAYSGVNVSPYIINRMIFSPIEPWRYEDLVDYPR